MLIYILQIYLSMLSLLEIVLIDINQIFIFTVFYSQSLHYGDRQKYFINLGFIQFIFLIIVIISSIIYLNFSLFISYSFLFNLENMKILIVFREFLIIKIYLDEFTKIFFCLPNFVILHLNYLIVCNICFEQSQAFYKYSLLYLY